MRELENKKKEIKTRVQHLPHKVNEAGIGSCHIYYLFIDIFCTHRDTKLKDHIHCTQSKVKLQFVMAVWLQIKGNEEYKVEGRRGRLLSSWHLHTTVGGSVQPRVDSLHLLLTTSLLIAAQCLHLQVMMRGYSMHTQHH